ncbi:protein SIX6OS1 [Dromaius novaehollandiae]|uniref:protein SIX6OS1 n=1 Tax=Dromaius novaehollandiae TaxID=8790 RepID=UPI00311F82A7
MNDRFLSNLDKLLLEFVFQLEQTSYAKECVKQQINLYTVKIVEKKNEIARLQEKINNSNDAIVCLHKQNENIKESYNDWKPTYLILREHEEYLKKELKANQEATENEEKMYQDYIIQYKEILEQHHKKYSETPLAQEYCRKKKEIEEIQNRILQQSERYKLQEGAYLDIEPTPFKSLHDWALQIASLRQKTQEILKHAAVATQESIALEKETEELEMKINYFKKTFEATTEAQNNSEMMEGTNKKSLEKPKEVKERIFEESEQPPLLNEEHQLYKPLHLSCIPQKSVQSVQTIRFSTQRTETGREEKEESVQHSVVTSSFSSQAENPAQMVSGNAGTNCPQIAEVSSIASLQNQMQFRQLIPPKQMTPNQQFESENTTTANQEAKCDDKEAEDESRDSSYTPQDVHACYKSGEDNPDTAEENDELFLRAPETPVFVRSPNSKEKKTQFSKTPPFDFIHNLGCEEETPKSPAFFSLMGFSQKSPGFNLFDSSVFGAENSSDETGESYSAGNLNPMSPHKDIGSLFGKSENEDAFAFPFPLESSSHAFGDGKDDFSFPFAFGQDQRSSQSPSMKGFLSSVQNTKPFTFF